MKKVITFGVYDMLHVGHVLLFKKAKELGDYLIVAVQDDDMILKYKPEAAKHSTLPLEGERERGFSFRRTHQRHAFLHRAA